MRGVTVGAWLMDLVDLEHGTGSNASVSLVFKFRKACCWRYESIFLTVAAVLAF